jgi:nucleotidyltransferase/DNA polymerase involved in DNA repair
MKIVKKYSPVYEIASLDEAYLDLSINHKTQRSLKFMIGRDYREYKKAEVLARKLKKEIFEKDTRYPNLIFETFEKNNESHNKSKIFSQKTNDFQILKKEAKKLLLRFLLENKKPIRLIGLRLKIW